MIPLPRPSSSGIGVSAGLPAVVTRAGSNATPGKRVLVIDDNPVIQRSMALILKSGGYHVMGALDGSEAYNMIRQERPDIILLDIHFVRNTNNESAVNVMDWDGFRIIEWLRRLGEAEDIPIIIVSSVEPEQFRERCRDIGALAWFRKPVDRARLLAIVEKTMATYAPKKTVQAKPVLKLDANRSPGVSPLI